MKRPARATVIEVWMHVIDPGKLRRRRRDKGLTQKQLAALISRTQQYVSALERGTDRDCSEATAERYAKWLDVTLEDYFEARSVIRVPTITTDSRVDGNAA